MEVEFNKQIAVLENEINFLKSSLTPTYQLIQELQEIKKKRHVSQAHNISNASIIGLEVKDEILKDVISIQISAEDKLEDLKNETSERFSDMSLDIGKIKDEIFSLQVNYREIVTSMNDLKNINADNANKIKEVFKDVDKKASLNNIDELRQVIKNMTPLYSFETLKSRVADCASAYQHHELQKKVESQRQKLKNYMKTSAVDKKLKEFYTVLSDDFRRDYLLIETFDNEKMVTGKTFKDIDDRFSSIKEYFNKLDHVTGEKIKAIKKNLDSNPWKPDIDSLIQEIAKKVPKAELESFTSETKDAVKTFYKQINGFKSYVEKFEKVLERFDEILLDKAEKDDIKRLNKTISTLASQDELENIKSDVLEHTQANEDRYATQVSKFEKLKVTFDCMIQKFEVLKKENFDVSNLSASVLEFKQLISRKADKEDIFEIYDNMCKRDEYTQTHNDLKLLKKQVEQGASLMFSLCRTLLKNGEPLAQIKKQRYELLKNFNSLINWITGNSVSLAFSSELTDRKELEETFEVNLDSKQSIMARRRSAFTAAEPKRHHINFPKVG
jgi:hypothetical protein